MAERGDVQTARLSPSVAGILCGAGAAACWAAGLVSARHAIVVGMSPLDITFHRLVWAGLFFLPSAFTGGAGDPRGIGWWRSITLSMTGAILISLLSYAGFILVPLGHGGVIQPSCAALGGLALSALVLRERLIAIRAAGAAMIVLGLCCIAYEAISTIGTHGLLGDLCFAAAGFMFATFGMLLKLWGISPVRAVAVTSVVALVLIPFQFAFGFHNMITAGAFEVAILAVVQGIFSGAGATFLFTRAVVLLGASRAAVYPALVPPFTLLIGFVALGNVPSVYQLAGLAIVLVGFRLTQKS